jgi:toxin-antitoxin system PIN domain toxin
MSPVYLLDANILIALSDDGHANHMRSRQWFSRTEQFATCPITQGALVRYLIRNGTSPQSVVESLALLKKHPGHQFWPDDLDYENLDLSGIYGYRQVTDTYLAGLAASHSGLLATLDIGLAHSHPHVTTLIPTESSQGNAPLL